MPLSQAEQEELELLELEEEEAAYQSAKSAPVEAKASGPSVTDSASRQFAGGATMGLDDETGGAFGALGRVAGIKNLASWKPLQSDSHLEFASPTLDPEEIQKAYIENRDALRGDQDADVATNPTASMVGKLGGGVTSAFIPGLGVLNAGKGATLAGTVGKSALAGGAQGAITGFGESESKNAGDLARDTAIGAGVGATIGAAIPGVAAVGQKALNSVQGAGKALKRGAESLAETATGATGAQAAKFQPGAGRELLDRGLVKFGDTAEKIGQRTDMAMQAANREIEHSLQALDAQGVTASIDNVVGALESKIDELAQIPGNESTIRQIQNHVDELYARGQSNIPLSAAEKAKRNYQGEVNYFSPEAQKKGAAHTGRAFREEVERSAQEFDSSIATKFKGAKKTYGLLAPIQEASEKRGFQQNQSPIGGLKDIAATAVGNIPGAVANRVLSPRIASSAAVAADNIADLVLKAPQALGKFAKPLQDASARGGNSLGATHFILQQTNPEYREILRKVAEEGEEQER